MITPGYPSLFQINTGFWLTELSRNLGPTAVLDDIPDAKLRRLVAMASDRLDAVPVIISTHVDLRF